MTTVKIRLKILDYLTATCFVNLLHLYLCLSYNNCVYLKRTGEQSLYHANINISAFPFLGSVMRFRCIYDLSS